VRSRTSGPVSSSSCARNCERRLPSRPSGTGIIRPDLLVPRRCPGSVIPAGYRGATSRIRITHRGVRAGPRTLGCEQAGKTQ
jgi:hypothetical protein